MGQSRHKINNRYRVDYVSRQLQCQLKSEYINKEYTQSLLDNLSMLLILRKKHFSYVEYLKNAYVRHKYDERLDVEGSPQNFVTESILHSTILLTCALAGNDKEDFGSIKKFEIKNWSELKWRSRLSPSIKHAKILERIFHLRNKLVGHIDINLSEIITERDVIKLIRIYDEYLVKKVELIFLKYLGHHQRNNLDFTDMSIQSYVLLFPRETSVWIPESKRIIKNIGD